MRSLTGGEGADTFNITHEAEGATPEELAAIVISDFDPEEDMLQITSEEPSSVDITPGTDESPTELRLSYENRPDLLIQLTNGATITQSDISFVAPAADTSPDASPETTPAAAPEATPAADEAAATV